MPITENDVRYGFRFLLGRDPIDAEVTKSLAQSTRGVDEFRRSLLRSPEFAENYVPRSKAGDIDPESFEDEPCVAFLHIPKTGGTTLRAILKFDIFPDVKVCPGVGNDLHARSPEELAPYGLYCAHFDFSALRYIPRRNLTLATLLREPRARSLSQYYFLRAHGSRRANRLDAEEYFERAAAPTDFLISNPMTRMLFGAWPLGERSGRDRQKRPSELAFERDPGGALKVALDRLERFAFVGIQEEFERSVALLCKVAEKQRPTKIKPLNVLRERMGTSLKEVEKQPVTPRLLAAIDRVTALDRVLYARGLEIFKERCAVAGI